MYEMTKSRRYAGPTAFFMILGLFLWSSSIPTQAQVLTTIIGPAPKSYQDSPYKSGNYERYLFFEGRRRRYLIHVPSSYRKNQPVPVILVFHGGGSNAEQIRWATRMDKKSDSAGFIAVYPDGTGRYKRFLTFNVGPGFGYAWKNKINDVGFVEVLLDDLEKLFNIDSKRIYATGLSNGAMMSYRLASDLPDRIAAIAPVGAVLPVSWLSFKKPVSIIHFHGLKDEQAPFQGGNGKPAFSLGKVKKFAPVMDTINWYVKNSGCSLTPSQTYTKGQATGRVYGPGKNGAEVILWTIKDGGHTWPGGRNILKRLGKVSYDISANDLMWDFFKRHPLK